MEKKTIVRWGCKHFPTQLVKKEHIAPTTKHAGNGLSCGLRVCGGRGEKGKRVGAGKRKSWGKPFEQRQRGKGEPLGCVMWVGGYLAQQKCRRG